MIFNMSGGGGGSGGLFYDMACQVAEPAKKEGRIWVKSSVPMTSFEFVNPWSGAGNGTVAISGNVGGANPLPTNNVIEVFNTKRNGINHREKIAPTACNQVQNGAWAPVDAYVCHSGTWVQFSWARLYLYNKGNEFTNITAGWTSRAFKTMDLPGANPTITRQSDRMLMSLSKTATGIVYATNKINLTNLKTLTFTGVMQRASSNISSWNFGLSVWSNFGTNYEDNRVAYTATDYSSTVGTCSIDVSKLSGEHYIGFVLRGNDGAASTITMMELWIV